MSTKTNHFNSINRRIIYLTDKIAWCIVNDKPYNFYLHEREALIWATDKIKELSSRLLNMITKPDNLTPEQELIYLRSRVESLEFDKARLSNDLFKERAKKRELAKVNSKLKTVVGCFKCQEPCSTYMLKDEIWLKAWPSYYRDKKENSGIFLELCFNCLRDSLDRPLTIDDFTDAPINNSVKTGFEIGLDYALQRSRLRV